MLPEPDLRAMIGTLPTITSFGPWSRGVRAQYLL
jgi:hypothetical protein